MATTKKTTAKKKSSGVKTGRIHQEILRQLRDPNVSRAKKDKLMEKLYEDIEFK